MTTMSATRRARRAIRAASPFAPIYSESKMRRLLFVGPRKGGEGGWVAQEKRPELPENNPDALRANGRLPSPWHDLGRPTSKIAAAMRAGINLAQVTE